MPNPNINWGGPQAVLCNVVAAFGVDNTGATDTGPTLATAFADLAASGQVSWLRSGTYKITTAAPPAAGQPVWVQPGVTFTGANAASVANVALVYGEAPGTPAYNPAWYTLTDVYWDPTAGNDTNTGMVGSPLLTFAEIVRRYGSAAPTFNAGQSVTIHKLTGQAAGVDPVFFQPKLSGGGQAVLLDTLIVVSAAFVGGAVTAKVRGAPGTRLQVAAMPAGTAAGMLVFNQTRGSYAFIDSMAGAVATMQQPLTTAALTTVGSPNIGPGSEDNTWATGDTLVVYNCSPLNLESWRPIGSDVSSGGTICTGWVQFSRILDPSGNTTSSYAHVADCGVSVLSACRVDGSVSMDISASSPAGPTGADGGVYMMGCTVLGALSILGAEAVFCGGGVVVDTFVANGGALLRLDCTIHGALILQGGYSTVDSTFCDGSISVNGGDLSYSVALWGSYTLTVNPRSAVINNTGLTWALTLLTAQTISFEGGTAVTPASLDTDGGLAMPLLGAGFCFATPGAAPVTIGNGYISVGIGATTGGIRLPFNTAIESLDSTGLVNITLLKVNGSNTVAIGDNTNSSAITLNVKSSGGVTQFVNGVQSWSATSTVFQFNVPLEGASALPLAVMNNGAGIAVGAGGSFTPSNAQLANPRTALTGNITATSSVTIALPNIQGLYFFDVTGLTLGANTLSFTSGTVTITYTAAQMPHGGLIIVSSQGGNTLAACP
jgi:hypothetical protein